MCSYRFPIIAREGWWLIGVFLVIGALGYHFASYTIAMIFWLMAGLLLWLYRDPPRRIPAAALGVVSPVDGVVTAISEARDAYVGRDARRISITMPITGVYSIRNPVEGRTMEQWFGEAAKSVPSFCRGAVHAQWLQTDEKDDLVMLVARGRTQLAPRLYAQSGERVGQGQRCGFVHFGARVEVLVPASAQIGIKTGDQVLAGSSIIATLVH
jgi:phosphatidylserine decarboxylase